MSQTQQTGGQECKQEPRGSAPNTQTTSTSHTTHNPEITETLTKQHAEPNFKKAFLRLVYIQKLYINLDIIGNYAHFRVKNLQFFLIILFLLSKISYS